MKNMTYARRLPKTSKKGNNWECGYIIPNPDYPKTGSMYLHRPIRYFMTWESADNWLKNEAKKDGLN